jgi:hypothetical protein
MPSHEYQLASDNISSAIMGAKIRARFRAKDIG